MRVPLLALAAAVFCAAPSSARDSGAVAQASAVKVKVSELGRSTSPVSVDVTAASAPGPMGVPPYNVEQHKELDLLTVLNQLDAARFQQRMRSLNEEKDEAAARNVLGAEKRKQTLAPLEDELKTLKAQGDLREEKRKAELAELTAQRDRLKLENEIAREKLNADQIKADEAKLKIETALRQLDYEDRKLKFDAEMAEHKTVALKTDLELREKKEVWKKEANREPETPLEPFKDGVLTVSDRRITLDGPIVSGMADYVTERIHYFNNKDESLPIFIVINKSPGGSVMEGYRIVKAIQSSKAPVHVVVKSFAASMAAVITTLAPHSYAYPNAIILHHQLIAFAWGNPTELKDQMRDIDEWYKRLAEPVAKKMGLSLDAYTKEMYKHNSDGDWMEFADRARQLHWVDHLVTEIRETGMTKEPSGGPPKPPAFMFLGLKEETDAQGRAYVRMPRLDPGDAYWIHNPDHYYR
jgi:ATP-dependent Clp protease protease subunit